MMNRRHSPPLRPLPALLALAALLLSPAAALPSPPPVILSLAPESAVSDKARKTWDFWTEAQSNPTLAAEFANPSYKPDSPHPSPFVHPSPYLALRIDPGPDLNPIFIGPIVCAFEFYYAPTNALPGLDPEAPVFRERPSFHTEVVDFSSGLPATVPLPSCIPNGNFLLPAYSRKNYSDRLVIRVLLQLYDSGPDADTFKKFYTVLPPFDTLNDTHVLASTNLPPDIWQSAGESSWEPWTPASYSASVPDDFPARFPHAAILSADDFAALADRPVLARRLALSATPVVAHGVKAPLLPASPAIPSNSILFRHPSNDAKHTPSVFDGFLDHDNLPSVFSPPVSVPGAYPVYALWLAAAFLLSALVSALLLVRVFRRPPALRASLWVAFPAAAFSLAILVLLAGLFLLPRTPRSDTVLFRVGYAGSPEEFCRASIRCFSFRDADWSFSFPSAQAGVDALRHLPDHAPSTLRRLDDSSTLDFPRGVRSTAISVLGSWFAPSSTPLTVEDTPYFDTIAAPEGTHRTITPTRDLDDLWVVIGTNRYHLGPVAAGTPVHPLPSQLLTTNDVLPSLPAPFNRLPPIVGCGCPDHSSESAADPLAGITINTVYGDDGPGSTSITFPDGTSVSLPPDEAAEYLKNYAESHPAPANSAPAPAPKPTPPWITIARVDSIDPWPAGPRLSPATQSTEQTLWITEWP